MRYKSLRTRLMLLLLIVGIIPVLTIVTYNYISTFTAFDQIQLDEQMQVEHAAVAQIQQETARVSALAELYSEQELVRQILQAANREQMQDVGSVLFDKVAAEHGLTHFEIGDANGVVLFRGHQPEKFGDDKSAVSAIQQALDGERLSGFEYGASGLALRAFVPIKDHNRVIGTLQIGVGDAFITNLQQLFPAVQMHLVNASNEVILSSTEALVGQHWAKEMALSEQVEREKNSDSKFFESYLPMLDPTQTERVGTFIIVKDIAALQSTMFAMINISMVILFVTIVCAVIIALLYSRTLTKPIIRTAQMMHTLSKGDLTERVEEHKRQDEIGQLMTDMRDMQQTLHQTISGVVRASHIVSSESTVLAQSTQEVSSGAEEIAQTMETLSRGIEKQTFEIAQVGDGMTEFTQNLCDTTTQGRKLESISVAVHTLTFDGKQLMDTSSEQMQQIHAVMAQSMHKMEDLGQRVQEITSFVSIIKDVADQTNLLALNASIEAARAGEHGKGFAVVAEEVRKLAEQVNLSVSEIAAIVGAVQSGSAEVSSSLKDGYRQVEHGAQQFVQTTKTFDDIEHSVTSLAQFLTQVMAQLDDMAAEGQQLHASIQEISAITQETAASVEETTATVMQTSTTMADVAAASEHLADLAEQLNVVVKGYKI